jgi:uncharacterized protein (TIGR02217 family)
LAFDEVRLSEDIERGAQGGPRFNTNITVTTGGYEKRNSNWGVPRYEFSISYPLRDRVYTEEIIKFFMARQGRARGFRFKDWSDYQSRSIIGVSNGSRTVYQAIKTYTSLLQFNRPLQKIVSGTRKIYLDGVLLAPSLYSIDVNTGVITLDNPPANGVVIEFECEFDVPVRFDKDNLDIGVQWSDAMSISSVQLIEVKIPLTIIP